MSKSNSRKPGLVDDCFYSLQAQLAEEGNTVRVYMGSSQKFDGFDVSNHNKGKILQAVTLHELAKKCDYVLCGTNNYNDVPAYEFFKHLGMPVLGYSAAVVLLEQDRDFAKIINKNLTINSIIKTPESHAFSDVESAVLFLEGNKESWVLKQSSMSPQHIQENRTWISLVQNHKMTIGLLQSSNNAWFDKSGVGGVIFEKYVKGQEVCFGAWFNGQHFQSPIYSCIEHKGAQNGDRGNMMTGEVGSTMKLHHLNYKTKIGQVFQKLELYLKGRCNGMIDINTILDAEGQLWFVEYTCRFGRPTLEMQLSMLKPEYSFNTALYKLASKEPVNLEALFDMKSYATGVTVFSYGIPFVGQTNSLGLNVSTPASLKLDFDLPKTLFPNRVDIRQIFCTFDTERNTWVTAPNERQFVVIGKGSSATLSTLSVYAVLKNYSLPTCTWRDDVGDNFAATEMLLSKYHII